MPAHFSPVPPSRQFGSSAVEFILVAVPILLVSLGTIELSRWFFIKQAVSLALLQAGRAAIVDHARPSTIQASFEQALLPIFAANHRATAAQRLEQALERRRRTMGAAPFRIIVRSPNQAAYVDFAAPRLSVVGAAGLAIIDNNYQAEQHKRYKAQGWNDGRGPTSGMNIFEANDLSLDVIYAHDPSVPGLGMLLKLIAFTAQGYTQQALAAGLLPISQTLTLPMQSHPVAWRSHSDKVVALTAALASVPAPTAPVPACHGFWCPLKSPRLDRDTEYARRGAGLPAASSAGQFGAVDASRLTAPASTTPPTESPSSNNPLCGVVLCCAGI